ncbi:MAG: helix-turn-helix domain-containing protein [Candidatus Poribacteria bacterium]|nr:helix-turn-helix domain-containing protein [Candidatus Poribacteria bacterium]
MNGYAQRIPNLDKFQRVMSTRGMTMDRLRKTVGKSTLYSALMLQRSRTQSDALASICVALRCGLDDLTDPRAN